MSTVVIRPPPHSDAAWQAAEEVVRARLAPHPFESFAPFLVGAILDSTLMGVVWVQLSVWTEYHAEKELRRVKVLAYWLVLTAIATTIFIWVCVHRLFVGQYGYFVQFDDRNWVSTVFVLYALGKVPTTLFFGERAWRLTDKSIVLATVLSILVVGSFVGAVISKVYFSMPSTDINSAIAGYAVIVWLCGEVISDIVITGTIAVQLVRSRTGWSGTDRLITQLLRLIVESQLPPTIVAIAFLVTFFTKPFSSTPYVFMAAPKVYVVCLLAVLNRKAKLRRHIESSQEWKPSSGGPSRAGGLSTQTDPHANIELDRMARRPEVFTHREPGPSGHDTDGGLAGERRDIYSAPTENRTRFVDDDKSPFDDYPTMGPAVRA